VGGTAAAAARAASATTIVTQANVARTRDACSHSNMDLVLYDLVEHQQKNEPRAPDGSRGSVQSTYFSNRYQRQTSSKTVVGQSPRVQSLPDRQAPSYPVPVR